MALYDKNRQNRLAGKLQGKATRCYDTTGLITFDSGPTIPTTLNTHAKWCIFVQTDASTVGDGIYINAGTSASPNFVPMTTLTSIISIPVAIPTLAGATGFWGWTVPLDCTLLTITEVHSVISTGAASLTIRKVTNASAPDALAGANVIELLSSAFDLQSTINVAVTKIPNVTALLQGHKLGFKVSAATTGLFGSVVTMNAIPT